MYLIDLGGLFRSSFENDFFNDSSAVLNTESNIFVGFLKYVAPVIKEINSPNCTILVEFSTILFWLMNHLQKLYEDLKLIYQLIKTYEKKYSPH